MPRSRLSCRAVNDMIRAVICFLFSVVMWAQAVPWAPANPTKHSYARDLATAIAQVGSSGVIATPPGSSTVSTNLTIPAGVKFAPSVGAVFTINNGVVLTINGPFEAFPSQVFNCVGTGKVSFGIGVVKEVYPQWWGAKGDSMAGNGYVGTNCTAAFQAAIDTMLPIFLIEGGYYVNASLTLPDATSNPNKQTIIRGLNGNLNSGYNRGNCFIEVDTAALFVSKTTFTTTAYQLQVNISNVCFFSHTSGNILFNNVNLMTSKFQNNLVVNFGQCFSMTSGVTEISGNHFLGQRDSVYKMLASNYAADTYIHHNYFNGYDQLGTVALIQLYSVAAFNISDNYFDFAKIGIWVYYSGTATAGKLTIHGNTFDILYRGILIQQSNEVSITGNIFRRCNLASRATYMPNNPNAAWACIEVTTNSYNIAATGNNYSVVDYFIKLNGAGIWGIFETGNVGDVGSWPMIDWTSKTYDTGTYPLDGQRIISNSRGLVRLAKSADYTIIPSDNYIVYTGTGSTLTLPAAYLGRNIRIKHAGSGTLTIARAGSDTIGGATSLAMTAGQSFEFIGSGTNWEAN